MGIKSFDFKSNHIHTHYCYYWTNYDNHCWCPTPQQHWNHNFCHFNSLPIYLLIISCKWSFDVRDSTGEIKYLYLILKQYCCFLLININAVVSSLYFDCKNCVKLQLSCLNCIVSYVLLNSVIINGLNCQLKSHSVLYTKYLFWCCKLRDGLMNSYFLH